ncbi:hypothetical protein GCM10023331_02320 [Algivirga pacifica]|uniref:Secretin/TonB short N-terminal domain-containing protein n=2 Tax=Algivirga pacifica TaxID=1162670 RepID=A0ABP9CX15_9BACT
MGLQAQEKALLDQKVTIHAEQQTLPAVLLTLSRSAQFDLAYNAEVLKNTSTIQLHLEEAPLQQVLDTLLYSQKLDYKCMGTQVVIFRQKTIIPPKIQITNTLSGIVVDHRTGQPLTEAKLYDKGLGHIATTNTQGIFTFRFHNPSIKLQLTVQQKGYQTKYIPLHLNRNLQIKIGLQANIPVDNTSLQIPQASTDIVALLDSLVPEEKRALESIPQAFTLNNTSIEELQMYQWFVPSIEKHEVQRDTLSRKWLKIGLLPVLSSNLIRDKYTINHVAINGLAGYAAGVRGYELAGITNIIRYNVHGVQIAGVNNIVGGVLRGVQLAGVTNINRFITSGVQFAGVYNQAGYHLNGVQIAGISNYIRGSMRGIQLAGISNHNQKGGKGVQIASLYNSVKGPFKGHQFSLLQNISTQNLEGTQWTLLRNQSKTIEGTQVGLLNQADTLKGVQLGLLNFSKEVTEGVPIGLLSFVKNGYQELEAGYQLNSLYTVSLKTGLPQFYNILSIGGMTESPEFLALGYGVGSHHQIYKRLGVNGDLMLYSLQHYQRLTRDNHWLANASIALSLKTGKRLTIFGGGNWNILQTSAIDESISSPTPISMYLTPYVRTESANGNVFMQWIGYQVGIRVKLNSEQ